MASDGPMQVTSHVDCSHRGDEVCHVPSMHLDPSEWALKKSETVLKAYLEEKEEVMYMREHFPHLDKIPKPYDEFVQRNRIETRILLNEGPHGRRHGNILEIFSISIHWNEKEHMARMFYHVFGNVLVSDTYDGDNCCLEAMNTSLQHPFTVLNGGHLPLHGLVRCLWYHPFIALIMFLRGHRVDSSGNSFEKESRVLIRKRLRLPVPSLPQLTEGWLGKPIERTVVGADEADDHLPFFKIHYSVVPEAFVVAVEVRLVWDKKEKLKSGEISIKGRLSVHWLEFEYLDRLCDYKIMLFDSKQESVSVGECFSTLRRMLAVPCGHTLVFDAAIYTEKGHEFIGQRSILVQCDDKFLVRTFGDGPLKMQITLFNFFSR